MEKNEEVNFEYDLKLCDDGTLIQLLFLYIIHRPAFYLKRFRDWIPSPLGPILPYLWTFPPPNRTP
jgi:hypothetical protein